MSLAASTERRGDAEIRSGKSLAAVLLAAVSGDASAAAQVPPAALDPALPVIARHHRVAPAVHHLVQHVADSPPQVTGALKADAAAQAVTRLKMAADLRWLSEALAPLGVPWAVFKGLALDRWWPRPGMRQFHDLDVLVPPAAFADVLGTLERDGGALLDRNWPLILREPHAELAVRLPHGTVLDLHWNPVWDRRRWPRARFSPTAMLVRAGRSTLEGTTVTTFDAADALLHTAYHAAAAGAFRLSWLKDVAVCATVTGLDWAAAGERARSQGIDLVVSLVLARAVRTFPGLELPAQATEASDGLWGRLAARVDRRYPVPSAMPGGRTGGHLYVSTRRTTAASLLTAVRTGYRTWGAATVNPHAPVADPLRLDRPDPRARHQYLAAVASRSIP